MSEKENLLKSVEKLGKIKGYLLIAVKDNNLIELKSGISTLEYLGLLEMVRINFESDKAIETIKNKLKDEGKL